MILMDLEFFFTEHAIGGGTGIKVLGTALPVQRWYDPQKGVKLWITMVLNCENVLADFLSSRWDDPQVTKLVIGLVVHLGWTPCHQVSIEWFEVVPHLPGEGC